MVSARGERAAMSGYKAQYLEFAQKVYDSMLNESLVEIRVADTEENVGKLDDICFVTKTEVHAYQIKWTIDNGSFGYSDFIELLPSIVDGWMKLKILYPDRLVVPHLLTNRKGTIEGQCITDDNNANLGHFSDFREEVLECLKVGKAVPNKWHDVLTKMRADVNKKIGHNISDDDFKAFWKVFEFVTDYQQKDICVRDASDTLKDRHLWLIIDLIIEMAASKERLVTKSCNEIFQELGLGSFIKRRYNHDLVVNLESYEPIQSAINELNTKIQSKTKGYIFLEGTPGSGKSTMLTRWSQSIPNKTVRYYAFDFTNPSSQLLNDSARGEKVLFLCEMVRQLGEKGYNPAYKALLNHEEIYLKEFFKEQLNKVHEEYEVTRLPVVIIVDGLDHIEREYKTQTSLLEALPSTNELPEGVIFVLGSQYYRNIGLNVHILQEYESGDFTVRMSPFTSEEVAHLATKIIGDNRLTDELLQTLVIKSAGHPLYLRYVLNQLKEMPDLSVDSIPSYDTDIEVYYSQIIGNLLHNDAICRFLGLLARVFGEIKDDFLREWSIDIQVQKDVFRQFRHLFLYNKVTRTRTFFHNSFRQYLLRETAIEHLTEEYSADIDSAYYAQLVQYVRDSKVENIWNIGSYLFKSGDEDAYIQLITPERIIEQIHAYRPIWHAQRDIEWGAQIAAKRNDVYLLVRMLLLHSQIDQMLSHEYDASSLIKEFLQLGMGDVAKIQIREGNSLHCSQDGALRLARMFYEYGDIQEARQLFEQSYPTFVSHAIDSHVRRDNIKHYITIMQEWVHSATYFWSIEAIEEKIHTFVDYLKNVALKANENFNSEDALYELKSKVVEALEDLDQWEELENYQKTFPEKVQKKVQFIIQLNKIQELISSTVPRDILHQEYSTLQTCYKALRTKKRDSLYPLMMASVAQRIGMSNRIIMRYLDKVRWDELPSFSTEVMYDSRFDILKQRIRYVELRAFVGYNDAMSQLVADSSFKSDGGLLLNYLRIIYTVAQWIGTANREGQNDVGLIQMIKPYLLFFDGCVANHQDRHAYNIEKQRGDFYEYLVKAAAQYGETTICKVGKIVQELYSGGYWKANEEDVRKLVLALYHYGIGVEWTKDMLGLIEAKMFEGQDIDGKQRESIEQGRAWLQIGDSEHALNMFHQAVIEASGVGYRKEYQPTTMAEWIGAANKHDPMHAVERIHWMTTRLHAIEDSCETRTVIRAGEKLLYETLALNLGMGLKLGEWLLDAELGIFGDVSYALVLSLLERIQSEDEYKVVFRYFSQIHLYILDDGYEVNTKLLESIYTKGRDLLGGNLDGYIKELRRCILTQCSEREQETMVKKLDELTALPVEEDQVQSEGSAKYEKYHRESDEWLKKADNLYIAGNTDDSWNTAMQALKASNYYGWAIYDDGGTRLNACRMLIKIDKQKGREITIRQLAEDLRHQISYGAMQYLDEIVPLLVDVPDEERLYAEELQYMNRILREDSITPEDAPEINPNSDGVCASMTKWLIFIMKMPILCISDKAKIQLAYMLDEGMSEILTYMQDDGCEPIDIMEVGMYVHALQSNALIHFKDYMKDYASHDNYQYRLYARAILQELNETPTVVSKRKELPVIYKMVLPNQHSVMFRQPAITEGYVDWDNQESVFSLCMHLLKYLSNCTKLNKKNIAMRAMQILKSQWTEPDWDNMAKWYSDAESRMAKHYYNIVLKYPYRRLRVGPIWSAMMEVVSELLDCDAISHPYDDNVFMTKDYAAILLEEHPKPLFVQRVAAKDSWTVSEKWNRKACDSERLSNEWVKIGENFVIGEVTHIIKPGDSQAIEDFSMTISYKGEKDSTDQLFGDEMFQHPTSDYLSCFEDDQHIIIIRDGYFGNNRMKQRWIAINPTLAYSLGWHPDADGYFAWTDENGKKMVESVYWQNGNVNYHGRDSIEMGEGWYVLASEDALEQLRSAGTLYLHQLIERRRDSDYNVPCSREYRVEDVQKYWHNQSL